MKSKPNLYSMIFLFAVLFGAANTSFAEIRILTENPVLPVQNRSFSNKNCANQAVEVDVFILNLEEYVLSSTHLPTHVDRPLGLLQRQAALHHSRAILPYYTYSKIITPSLSPHKLLFPFHNFI